MASRASGSTPPSRWLTPEDEALTADRPVVYEAITDPEQPPLPPHIRMEQVTSMAKALLDGDPNAGRIVRQSLKGKLAEFVNR